MDLTNLEYELLIATPTGVGASTGRETEEAFNNNFEITKNAIQQLILAVANQVVSEELRQFRVDTSVNPNVIYYSLDEPGTVDPKWVRLLELSFNNISGDPLSNIALKEILDGKASASELNSISNRVTINENAIKNINDALDPISTLVYANKAAIAILEENFSIAVKTTEGNTLFLRYNPVEKTLEYSTNGTDWINTAGTSVTFDNLSGNPADNEALVTYIADQIDSGSGDYVSNTAFVGHTGDFGNPHQVTKIQVGLSNVENYSPENMPLSTEAQTRFAQLESQFPAFEYLSRAEYDLITPENKIYMISNHF